MALAWIFEGMRKFRLPVNDKAFVILLAAVGVIEGGS